MDADGTNIRPLTDNGANHVSYSDLVWSPDGTHIVFGSHDGSSAESSISVMEVNDGNIMHLTDTLARYSHLMRSPDGTQIAFVSNRGDDSGIYIMVNLHNRMKRA